MFERLGALKNTTGYFGHRGWALGWGLGVRMGVKLAWPERPVLAMLGEGAAMYGIQGLWSAAHYRLPVTFVVPTTPSTRFSRSARKQLALPAAKSGRYEGLDLVGPEVDLVALARSLGVEAHRITEPDELADARRRVARRRRSSALRRAHPARRTPARLSY